MKIPHHNGLPLLGQAITAVRDPLSFLVRLQEVYPDVVSIRILGKKYYIIQHPDICRRILQENARNYFKPGMAKELKRFLGEGLATSNGKNWLRQRRLMQPAFHQKRIELLVDVINGETTGLINSWKSQGLPDVKNINRDFMNLTLTNLTKAMFGTDLKQSLDRIAEVVNRLLEYGTRRATALIKVPHYLPTPANVRYKKANQAFESIISELIQKRKRGKADNGADVGKDVFDILLQAYDKAGSHMTRKRLRDEIATIFMAGHETTAQTLSWVFYQLAANPSIAEKVRAEALALGQDQPTYASLQKLEYTKAVINEALRCYPPVWVIARRAHADDAVNSTMTIPKGATVLLNVYGMHHNPLYWNCAADFRPDNFSAVNENKIPAFAYLPFGGGPRICIGKHFAMMVMQTVVFQLIREFEFSLPEGFQASVQPGITLRSKEGIFLCVRTLGPDNH